MNFIRTTNILFMTLGLFLSTGCKQANQKKDNSSQVVEKTYTEEELYRPNFHFTPKANWINDPNGMFYYNEYFHLYFQYYPDGNVWGPMHWGHAISTDMVTWKEQPIAIYPDEKGFIFSGSSVVDLDNTSGFGGKNRPPIVAMFTYHDMEAEKAGKPTYESQAIAYSLDEGKTFIKYEGNPVIKNPGIKDFRDPKMVWDPISKKWIVVLSAGNEIQFYSSTNLKEWKLESSFGKNVGAHGGVWECPDLFPIQVQGTNETKWVLLVSINPGSPNGGSGTQYFVGDFDGKNFTMDNSFENDLKNSPYKSLWIDYGRDNYAGVTWSNVTTSDGGKLFIGWMSNWQYANKVPTETWRGAMTTARKLKLYKTESSYKIHFQPVNELSNYISANYKTSNISIKDETKIIDSDKIDLSRAEIKFKISNLNDNVFTFKLSNTLGDQLKFGYDNYQKQFFIDRTFSGKIDFSENFANKISIAPRTSNNKYLTGTILFDKTSIELFFDDGETTMTEIFYPNEPFDKLTIESNHQFILDTIEANQLTLN